MGYTQRALALLCTSLLAVWLASVRLAAIAAPSGRGAEAPRAPVRAIHSAGTIIVADGNLRLFSPLSQPELVEMIPGAGSGQVAVDDAGTIYAANFGAGNVTIFLRGHPKPTLTLTDGVHHPHAVAVDKNGTVYVGNSGPPSIAEFPKGSRHPSVTFSTGIPSAFGMTLDRAGNLYVAAQGSGVVVVPAGATAGQSLGLQGLTQAAGVALDAAGNLYVADFEDVKVFAPQQKTAKQVFERGHHPTALTFGPDGVLWVTNCCGRMTFGTVLGYLPGKTRPFTAFGAHFHPIGIAVSSLSPL
jgi:DNA-binding beta-propeller fold protein YncE